MDGPDHRDGEPDEGDGEPDDGDDPFASLVLDDAFVAGATRSEAKADHRAPTRPTPRPDLPRRRSRVRSLWDRDRRTILVVSAIVVAILGIAAVEGIGPFAPDSGFLQALHLAAHPRPPAPVVSAAAPSASHDANDTSTSTTLTFASRTYRPGECITWNQQGAGSDEATPAVPCGDPHLVEMTSKVVLTTFSADAAFPDEAGWQQIDSADCGPPAERYLGYPLDPRGRFFPTSLRPTPLSWNAGDRTIWCGIAALPTAGPAPSELTPFTGAVRGQDQTLLYSTGTCLALGSPGSLGDPVPCDGVHAVEVVGTVSLAGQTTYPQGEDQWSSAVRPTCSQEAAQYVGGTLPAGVESGWLTFPESSWDAGRRVAQCTVGWYDADGTLTTGSAPLRIGAT